MRQLPEEVSEALWAASGSVPGLPKYTKSPLLLAITAFFFFFERGKGIKLGGARGTLGESTDVHQRSRTCAMLIQVWGSNWGSSFSSLVITKNFVAFVFLHAWSAKSQRPHFEPHGQRRHYTGRYRRSGISGVHLWGKV